MEYGLVRVVAIYALPVIFAITLHEAAHGYVARYFGDMTAQAEGRISLNPLRHIDPFGTVLVPLAMLAVGGPAFGWAKPVPVNMAALRNPKKDMLWVAAAGPAANLFMALAWALFFKIASVLPANDFTLPMEFMGKAGITVNLVLMFLNLLPIPPLDGGRIAVSLLPHRLAWGYSKIEPFGLMILVLLMIPNLFGPSSLLWQGMAPMLNISERVIQNLLQI